MTLADLIHDRGLSQADVAETLGVTQATVSRKLSGKSGLSLPQVRALAALLQITPAEVVEATSDEGAA